MTRYIVMILAIFTVFTFGKAQAEPRIYTKSDNLAVSGYDTVAYFTQNRPVKGNSAYAVQWQGATWLFSSAAHLEKFKSAPTRYAPQYGGYCAWAVAHGSLAPGDPLQWHIENGKLYLNVNANIKRQWLPRRAELIPKADRNFPGLVR